MLPSIVPDYRINDRSRNRSFFLHHFITRLPHLPCRLTRRTLRSLFAHHSPRLSPRRSRRALRLLLLLLALRSGFLFLAGLDGFLAGGGSGFGTL